MKRFLLIASCAFLSASLFSSCQKEDRSVLELARDLTAELQKVTDHKSAEALAPRVEVLNKRFQNATARPFAAEATSLQRASSEDADGQEGAALQDALKALAHEIGRVQASLPVTSHDGDVDRDRLLMAVGAANGAGDEAPASQRKSVGNTHMKGESAKSESPGNFAEYYGSDKLREALTYDAAPGSIAAFAFEDAPEPVPAAGAIAEDEPEETPAAEETTDDTTPAADTDDDTTTTATTDDDTTTDTTDDITPADDDDSSTPSDDDGLPSLDTDSGSDDDSSDDSGSDDDGGSDDIEDISIDI